MRRAVQVTDAEVDALFARAELLIRDAKFRTAAVNARMSRAGVIPPDRRQKAVDRRRSAEADRRANMRRRRGSDELSTAR